MRVIDTQHPREGAGAESIARGATQTLLLVDDAALVHSPHVTSLGTAPVPAAVLTDVAFRYSLGRDAAGTEW